MDNVNVDEKKHSGLTREYHEHKTDALHRHDRPVFQPRNVCYSKYIPAIEK